MTDTLRFEVLAVYHSGTTRGDIPEPSLEQERHGAVPSEPNDKRSGKPDVFHLDTVMASGPKQAAGQAMLNVLRKSSARGSEPDWARRLSHARDADILRVLPIGSGTDVAKREKPFEPTELEEFSMAQTFEPDDMPELPDRQAIEETFEIKGERVLPSEGSDESGE